ncbi:FliI/YscN family ATPase [Buchnera aphidicola]|uniref:Flagellum-specific ATP synthase n=1 Tax=Buchnera aphidicola subsp. Tuberolachnus salignus TaxID=98804 RepID=A0A160SYD6_BUCTT|nr:FliI/YscN family ATPase [Buchnera aphidicola]CUR53031.1 Flagellum-specific ATP synthase [Buchnera aphidicola (Tuberolachnus salignus)]
MIFQKNPWFYELDNFKNKIKFLPHFILSGYLISINDLVLEVVGLHHEIGSICYIECFKNFKRFLVTCEIIGFQEKKTFLIAFDCTYNFFPKARVFIKNNSQSFFENKQIFPFGNGLLGRVLDSTGIPIDTLGSFKGEVVYNTVYHKQINPLKRQPINKIFDTGIRAINSLLTIGRGQRIGIFARPGVGKSLLLGMITRHSSVDIIIIALIGERNREVLDFVRQVLDVTSLKKSIIIVSSADSPPILRVKAASYATSLAEFFRSLNKNVLLICDSLTRYAIAYREISLSLGSFPISRGYPASIFSKIPELIERTGNSENKLGTITSFYTILTEGDMDNDPILDISKSILDGHIFLSDKLANSGHYPAIDIETSISRLMSSIISPEHLKNSIFLKKLISCYNTNKDLVTLGAYTNGQNLLLDQAIKIWPFLEKFLQQDFLLNYSYRTSIIQLEKLLNKLKIR